MIDEKKLIEEIEEEVSSDKLGLSRYIPIRAMKEMVESQLKIGEWIPCSERLPEEDTDVLIYTPYDGVDMAYISDENWRYTRGDEFIGTVENLNVLAWKPLPAPYEVKSDE